MKNILKELFSSSRFKSLLWRSATMILAFVITYITDNLTQLNISQEVTVLVGLILGEITKALNNYSQGLENK